MTIAPNWLFRLSRMSVKGFGVGKPQGVKIGSDGHGTWKPHSIGSPWRAIILEQVDSSRFPRRNTIEAFETPPSPVSSFSHQTASKLARLRDDLPRTLNSVSITLDRQTPEGILLAWPISSLVKRLSRKI